jgi:O-antigen/teichoic acid export membrane protein
LGEKRTEAAAPGAGDYGKTAGFLSIGVGLTGAITYLYFVIASHVLSKPAYGQVTVLWSAVFITVSTLYRPIDQLLSRHISERLVRSEPVGEPMRVAAKIQLGLALCFAVLALALRGPIQDDLLEGNEVLYWVFFSAVLFYAASYFARGYLAGHRRFGLFTALILSESFFRTIFAVLVAIGILDGQDAVAIGIVAAPSLSLLVVPLAFARQASRNTQSQPAVNPGTPGREAEDVPGRHAEDVPGSYSDEPATFDVDAAEGPGGGPEAAPEFSLSHGTGFAAAVLLIMFSEQTFLNAGPLIVRGVEGAAAAGFIFNVLMIARAPLQLFQAVSTSILPHLTSLHTSTEESSEDEFHSSIWLVLKAIAAFTGIVALTVLIAGPELMQIAFSNKFTYERIGLLLVTAGMGLYLSAVTINQACLAQGQVKRASVRWISCAVFFVGWNLLPIISDTARRVEIGFALTAALLLALLVHIFRHPHVRVEDIPEAEDRAEPEVQLAAADEGA